MKHAPKTYDEISRRTVIRSDGTSGPIPTDEGEFPPDAELYAQVTNALVATGHDEVGVEVVNGRVILRGQVQDQPTLDRIVRIVATTTDAEIENRMHF